MRAGVGVVRERVERIQLHRARRFGAGARLFTFAVLRVVDEGILEVNEGQRRMRPGEVRRVSRRRGEQGLGRSKIEPACAIHVTQAEMECAPCVEIGRCGQRRPGRLLLRDPSLQRSKDLGRHALAQHVHVVGPSAVLVGPDQSAARRICQFGGQFHPRACQRDCAGQHIACTEAVGRIDRIAGGAVELETRGAGDHLQPAQPRQCRDQIVRQRQGGRKARIVAKALKRQDGERWRPAAHIKAPGAG